MVTKDSIYAYYFHDNPMGNIHDNYERSFSFRIFYPASFQELNKVTFLGSDCEIQSGGKITSPITYYYFDGIAIDSLHIDRRKGIDYYEVVAKPKTRIQPDNSSKLNLNFLQNDEEKKLIVPLQELPISAVQ